MDFEDRRKLLRHLLDTLDGMPADVVPDATFTLDELFDAWQMDWRLAVDLVRRMEAARAVTAELDKGLAESDRVAWRYETPVEAEAEQDRRLYWLLTESKDWK